MGVYIPGMEMPTNCHDCRFCGWSNFWQVYDCRMAKPNTFLLFNGEKTNSDSKTRNGRADNCPLIPVPPHGRLIDADALCEGLVSNHPVVIYARSEPTIIPADPAKEGEG